MIDYDKDSEEEYLEENAEDIKSVDNSADEEDKPEEGEEDENVWIVPDGHLSEDEVSDNDCNSKYNLKEDSDGVENKNRTNGILDYLDIRKTYQKPVTVDFRAQSSDNRYRVLQQALAARIFVLPNSESEPSTSESFPIKILTKKSDDDKQNGTLHESIKERLEDVVSEIHGSYSTKELLIKAINDKFSLISKKTISNFFKNSVIKSKDKVISILILEAMVCEGGNTNSFEFT